MSVEVTALKKEEDKKSQDRLADLEKELAEQRDLFQEKKAQWDNEKNSVEHVQKIREELDNVRKEITTAEQNYDLDKAAELKYGRLPASYGKPAKIVKLFGGKERYEQAVKELEENIYEIEVG